MIAVILCGGLGTRLRPLTYDIPKPMVPVLGKPFLVYLVELLRGYGIRKFIFLTGYLSEQIERYFGDGSAFGVTIAYQREKERLDTGGAIKAARRLITDDFLLCFGDSIIYLDYTRLIKRSKKIRPRSAILVLSKNDSGDSCFARHNARVERGRVIEYSKKEPKKHFNSFDSGVLLCRKGVLGELPRKKIFSLEEEMYNRLSQTGRLFAYPSRKKPFDIGTPGRVKAFETYLRSLPRN